MLFFLCDFSLLPPSRFFSFFLDYCLNYPKNTFPIIRTFYSSQSKLPQDSDYCLFPSWFILFILCHAWRPLNSSLEVSQQWFIKEVQIQINGLDTLVACIIYEIVKRSTVVYIPKIRGKFAVAVSSYLTNSFNSQLPDPTTVEMQTPTHVELCTKPINKTKNKAPQGGGASQGNSI